MKKLLKPQLVFYLWGFWIVAGIIAFFLIVKINKITFILIFFLFLLRVWLSSIDIRSKDVIVLPLLMILTWSKLMFFF